MLCLSLCIISARKKYREPLSLCFSSILSLSCVVAASLVFLQGTNVDEAKVLIASSGMKILPVSDLEEAARLSCKLSKIIEIAKETKLTVQFGGLLTI